MPVNIDKVNAAYAKITWDRVQSEPQSSPIALLNSSFMFYADNFLYDPRYKDGVWDGKIRLFKTSTGLLPSGLVPKAATILKTAGFAVNIGSTMHDMFRSDITDDDIKRFISRITTDMHGIIPYAGHALHDRHGRSGTPGAAQARQRRLHSQARHGQGAVHRSAV